MNGWMPDNIGLVPESKDLVESRQSRVHLRLVNPDISYPKTACALKSAFGEWWTGKADEVTCTACKEWAHA